MRAEISNDFDQAEGYALCNRFSAMRIRAPFIALALVISLASAPAVHAGPGLLQRVSSWVAPARARAQLAKDCANIHNQLYERHQPTPLSASENLANGVAKAKRYGDSWTCNVSSTLLISALKKVGHTLQQHSSGKETFRWGSLGLVDYHYYAVDRVKSPRLLVDPVAFPNFRSAAQPAGKMRQWLTEAAQTLGRPALGIELADRLSKGRDGELLVLQGKTEIAIYQAALEKAADLYKSRRTSSISH